MHDYENSPEQTRLHLNGSPSGLAVPADMMLEFILLAVEDCPECGIPSAVIRVTPQLEKANHAS
jgi:hypothetical protein